MAQRTEQGFPRNVQTSVYSVYLGFIDDLFLGYLSPHRRLINQRYSLGIQILVSSSPLRMLNTILNSSSMKTLRHRYLNHRKGKKSTKLLLSKKDGGTLVLEESEQLRTIVTNYLSRGGMNETIRSYYNQHYAISLSKKM